MPMPETAVDASPRELRTVSQFAEQWQAWTRPALRNLILNARDRLNSRGEKIAGNGLEEAGAVIRLGRRVLIDERAFFRWLATQQKKPHAMNSRRHARTSERQAPAGGRMTHGAGCMNTEHGIALPTHRREEAT
jgi:hypothetical protein